MDRYVVSSVPLSRGNASKRLIKRLEKRNRRAEMDPRELTGLMNIVSPGATGFIDHARLSSRIACTREQTHESRDSKKVNDLRTEEHRLDYNYYFSVGLET